MTPWYTMHNLIKTNNSTFQNQEFKCLQPQIHCPQTFRRLPAPVTIPKIQFFLPSTHTTAPRRCGNCACDLSFWDPGAY
jgi:hypothetical protein